MIPVSKHYEVPESIDLERNLCQGVRAVDGQLRSAKIPLENVNVTGIIHGRSIVSSKTSKRGK